jgi:hypothetical protein
MSNSSSEALTASPIGDDNAENPSTHRMLKMLLPTALPTAMSRWPLTAAAIDAAT